jgi:bifunctional polynucleotide phosphatase/kinase
MFNFIPEKIVPLFTPSSSPLLPHPPVQELILFVGYPCLGKTTFFRQYFEAAGYLHINQDTLKTRDKCVKAVQAELKAGNKCVVGMNPSFYL